MTKTLKKIRVKPKVNPVVVSLVSMPFKDLRHPPIQLGILEMCLTRVGFTARSHSFELAFMEFLHLRTASMPEEERLTISNYEQIACHDFVVNLGDWIFKVAPYEESLVSDDEYLEYIRKNGTPDGSIQIAKRMKKLVPDFLEAAADELLAYNPKIVGFSTVFQQNMASLVLAKILKKKDPLITIVFGGGNCDGPMGAALHKCFPWIDVVVRGEGERVFIEVVSDLLESRPIRPQPGICYRVEGKSMVIPQKNEPQVPISEVPVPIYDEFFERLDRSPLKEELRSEVAILFESSRGCWWGAKHHCTFCGLNGSLMNFRSKSASQVAEEILNYARRYKILDFVAVDDIIDLGHIRDLMPLLASAGCDLQIFYETKSNLNKDQLRMLYSGGVNAIQPGIESLSTPILKLMKKGVTALQNIRLLKWCAELGIKPAWNILYGFPGESPNDYERMAALLPSLVHLEPPNIMQVELQRFSPYHNRPLDYGIIVTGPSPKYKMIYDLPYDVTMDLAYDFDYTYLDGRDPESYVGPLKDAVNSWHQLTKEERGYLHFRRGPDFLLVQDRRSSYEHADYQFDGIEAKIYLACDSGVTLDELKTQFTQKEIDGPDMEDIESYLNDLVEAGLMFREDNRFLSLAIDSKSNFTGLTDVSEKVNSKLSLVKY